MQLGSKERPTDDVFLLSTTHGAESTALAAAISTMRVYREEPVIEHLHRQGARLAAGIREATLRHGVTKSVEAAGRACNLVYVTRGPDGAPSQSYRALFMQELIRHGVLAPSFVVSYSHTDEDIDRTIDAIDGALGLYKRALEHGPEAFLVGRPTRHVFEHR